MQAAGDRTYPWGPSTGSGRSDDFDPTLANTEESNLGQTTPVHMYRDGKTPEGVWDLSGNVWEWSADVDTDGWPWLKGGAYYLDAKGVTSAARFIHLPFDWLHDLGFRVVVVPISRE